MGDFTASNEEILSECEAIEIERIFYVEKSVDLLEKHDLVLRVYDRIKKRFQSMNIGLLGVFFTGYMYGIRAERNRKAGRNNNSNINLNNEIIKTLGQLSPKNLNRTYIFSKGLLKNESNQGHRESKPLGRTAQ